MYEGMEQGKGRKNERGDGRRDNRREGNESTTQLKSPGRVSGGRLLILNIAHDKQHGSRKTP